MENSLFMEENMVKAITGPVDLDTGANTGARFDMSKFQKVTFICVAAAGTTPNSHTFSFQQHDAASSGNTAALSIDTPYFHKLDTATYFTKVTPGAAASSFNLDSLVLDAKYIVVFEVNADQLDRDTGYSWVSINQTDAGGAQLGTTIAIGSNSVANPAYSKVV